MTPRTTVTIDMRSVLNNKIVRYTVIVLVVFVLIAIVGGGWYFSGVLEKDGLRVDHEPGEFRVKITDIGPDTITLRQIRGAEEEKNLSLSAIWGITDDDNYGQLGDVISEIDGLVTREFTLLEGELQVGSDVRFDRGSFPHDPYSAYGLDYQEEFFSAPLGELGAWYLEADSNTWAILVHGRTSNRNSSLKIIDDLERLNVHSLTIDYRNDEDAPASESGYYEYGATEWEDVESAVRLALDNGAEDIVLIGYSMGGGIVVNYQLKSELFGHTVGIVLDAPMLNFGRTIDKGAEERSVPAPITFAAKLIAAARFGIDWGAVDFLAQADELDIPILLFHGDEDNTVPIETSNEFAIVLPGTVEMHTFKGAGHGQSWNLYRSEYESTLADFIDRVR
ncbi:MAG: alpha/beta fold hydrolase [Dehalococcoidia bacterium]|nr:hypothetical protein [Chloroflexota bacterium]MDP6055801.1 alpha/beta fold hydrolase [Dehalococcoidia bacterium]MDP7262830.1 alpha/beta fold hydrolase [Dehalococcoidia bacterium]MDP7485847.1 alpha/beta fold hydrolase [Dehalococcoidia bacterium]